MFKHEGPARTTRKNAILAGYLALVAGFVNASGFIAIGTVTSHVTGNVSRIGIELARGNTDVATVILLMVFTFFLGALIASLIVEANFFRVRARGYATALFVEAVALTTFWFVPPEATPLSLGFAMGMQNSLVTRLSGAVVRTTHLTGVVTDLGIEAARWLRRRDANPARIALLATIIATFAIGSALGAFVAFHEQSSSSALIFPVAAVLIASGYALFESRSFAAAH